MAYWNTSVQTFFLPHDKLWLSALKDITAAFFMFVMKVTVRFRHLFYLRIDEFLTDFCSFEIGDR